LQTALLDRVASIEHLFVYAETVGGERMRGRGKTGSPLGPSTMRADLSERLGPLATVRARAHGEEDHDAGEDSPDGPGFVPCDGCQRQADDQHPKECGEYDRRPLFANPFPGAAAFGL